MKDYPVLRFISGCLRVVGWLAFAASVFFTLVYGAVLLQQTSNPAAAYGDLNAANAAIKIWGTAAGIVSSLTMIVVGELIQVFTDIAINTAPIAQLVEYSKETNAFFSRVAAKTNPSEQSR